MQFRRYLETSDAIDSGSVLMFFQDSGVTLINETLEYRKLTSPNDEQFGSPDNIVIEDDDRVCF